MNYPDPEQNLTETEAVTDDIFESDLERITRERAELEAQLESIAERSRLEEIVEAEYVAPPREKTKFTKVSDIHIPDEMFNTLKTGNKHIDRCLSEPGGLVPSQAILLTGVPGGGKTTLSCYIGATCVEHQIKEGVPEDQIRPAIFISREMSDFQLKLQSRKINNFDLLTIVADRGDYRNWIEDIKELDPKPCVVIVDSLQKIASESHMGGVGMNKKQIELVEAWQKFAKDTFIPVILIGHVGKDGNYIGPSAIKHEVDCHLHIEIDKDSGDRVFEMEKNRFGEVHIQVPMRFTLFGLDFGDGLDAIDDVEDVEELVSHFKMLSRDARVINPKLAAKVIPQVMEHLREKYKEFLEDKNGVVPPIQLTWKGKKFLCYYTKSRINIGREGILKLTDKVKSGYKMERPFMDKIVRTREDVLMWIVIHEFCHLLPGCEKHTLDFFKIVYKTAKENIFLFSQDHGGNSMDTIPLMVPA